MLYIQLSSTYAPAWAFGGVVRILYGYALRMAQRCETMALVGDLDERQRKIGPEFDELQPFAIRRYGLAFPSFARRNVHAVSLRMAVDTLRLVGRSPSRVVLHIGEIRGVPNLCAILARWRYGEKVIIVHSALGGLHEKASRLRDFYDRLFAKSFYRAMDVAIAENEHEAEEYRRLMTRWGVQIRDSQVRIVPLQLDDGRRPESWFDASGRKAPSVLRETRADLGLSVEGPIVCFLGRFHEKKGILRAVDTFCAWRAKSGQDATFLIIGRDEGFEAQIREHVAACPYPDAIRIITDVYEQRFSYYYASDLFIGLPTMFEETMLSSLEALSCGAPVLLSREADAPYVEAGDAGLVIDFTLEGAVAGMEALLSNPGSRAAKAREVAKRFSASEVFAQFESAIAAGLGRA